MFWSLLCLFIGVFLVVFGVLVAEGWLSILLGVLMIAFGGFLLLGSILIKKAPILTRYAKVFGKTTKTSGGDYVSGDDESGSASYTTPVTTSYFISFEFDDRRVNVDVDVSLYNTVEEGDMGLLDYKDIGGRFRFISFKRD